MQLPFLDTSAMAYFIIMTLSTQLWVQRFDIEADAAVGKRTTAVFVGSGISTAVLLTLLAVELQCGMSWGCLGAQVFTGYSICVLVVELMVCSKLLTTVLMGVGGAGSALGFWR